MEDKRGAGKRVEWKEREGKGKDEVREEKGKRRKGDRKIKENRREEKGRKEKMREEKRKEWEGMGIKGRKGKACERKKMKMTFQTAGSVCVASLKINKKIALRKQEGFCAVGFKSV